MRSCAQQRFRARVHLIERGSEALGGDRAARDRMRSVGSTRCGDVNRPVRRPAARRPDSIMAQVEPLPLVPATWTKRQACCGMAQRVEQSAHPLQAQLGGLDLVAQRVQETDGIGIVHAAWYRARLTVTASVN